MHHPYSRHAFVIKALRLLAVALILFGELWVFVWSLLACKWPSPALKSKQANNAPSTHVLLIADTQVQHSALLPEDSWWSQPFRRVLFDLNLRKSWRVASHLKPDAVVFLGDMLSKGKAAKNHQQYKAAAEKFKSFFHIGPRTEVYHIPGNNDLGLGLDRSTSRVLRSFYREFFGDLNRKFVLQNHTFLAIDSAGLIDEDYLRNGEHLSFQDWSPLPHGTVSFVKQVAQQDPVGPLILLSHIPLARSDSAYCGPLREHGTIRRGAGPGWQTTLSKQSTVFLLDTLRPSIIFSADNRDYCDYTHAVDPPWDSSMKPYRVREITLKSFSMSVHISRPGFQLLTLVDPTYRNGLSSSGGLPTSLAERLCLLPDQYGIYNYLYAPLFIVSLLILARIHFWKPKKGRFRSKRPVLALNVELTQLSESPRTLTGPLPSISPGAEPLWSPFVPFTPVTPHIQAKMRQPYITSVASIESTRRQSSVSSLSSTTTLLGGENAQEKDNELSDEQELVYADFPSEYAMGSAEKLSFSLMSPSKRPGGFGSRHPYIRQSSTMDMESFQDERVVDEEAEPTKECGSPEAHGDLADGLGRTRRHRQSASYSFVFRGRRRRIRLGLPSRSAFWNLMEFIGLVDESNLLDTSRGHRIGRRRGLSGYIRDVVDVFWPAVLAWVVVNGLATL